MDMVGSSEKVPASAKRSEAYPVVVAEVRSSVDVRV